MIRKILFSEFFAFVYGHGCVCSHRAAALCGATVSLVHVCDLASHWGFDERRVSPSQLNGIRTDVL